MTGGPYGRDGDLDAFIVDRYLDSLLARQPADGTGLPQDLRVTAGRLARGLPRYHPSFRFEEHLAARLAAAASASARAGELVDFPRAARGSDPDAADPAVIGDARPGPARPVVIGSVLTSAALSLVGAAFVAWRRAHPPVDPMTRAVRAIARGRA